MNPPLLSVHDHQVILEHGYYIFKWTGNAYTQQEKYKCHTFDPPVIFPEGELFCPSKFMTPMRKLPVGITR